MHTYNIVYSLIQLPPEAYILGSRFTHTGTSSSHHVHQRQWCTGARAFWRIKSKVPPPKVSQHRCSIPCGLLSQGDATKSVHTHTYIAGQGVTSAPVYVPTTHSTCSQAPGLSAFQTPRLHCDWSHWAPSQLATHPTVWIDVVAMVTATALQQ